MEPWVSSLQSASGSDPVAIAFEALALLTHSTNTSSATTIHRRTNTDSAILKAHLLSQHAGGVVTSTCRAVFTDAWWRSRQATAAMLMSTADLTCGVSGGSYLHSNGEVMSSHRQRLINDPTLVTPVKVAAAILAHLRDGGAPGPITPANAISEVTTPNVSHSVASLFTRFLQSSKMVVAQNASYQNSPANKKKLNRSAGKTPDVAAAVPNSSNASSAATQVLSANEAIAQAYALATAAAAATSSTSPSTTATANFHKLLSRLLECLNNTQSMAVKTSIMEAITTYLQMCSVLMEEMVLGVVIEEICEEVAEKLHSNRKEVIAKMKKEKRLQQQLKQTINNFPITINTTANLTSESDLGVGYGDVADGGNGGVASFGTDGGSDVADDDGPYDDGDEEDAEAVARIWQDLTFETSRLLLPPQWLADVLRLLPEAALTTAYAAYTQHQQTKLDDASTTSNAVHSSNVASSVNTRTQMNANNSNNISATHDVSHHDESERNLLPLPIVTALRNSVTFPTLANADDSLVMSYANKTLVAEKALDCMDSLLVDPSEAMWAAVGDGALFGGGVSGANASSQLESSSNMNILLAGSLNNNTAGAGPAVASPQLLSASSRLYNNRAQLAMIGSPNLGPANDAAAAAVAGSGGGVPTAASLPCRQLHPCLRYVLSNVTTLSSQQRAASATTVMLWDHLVRFHIDVLPASTTAALASALIVPQSNNDLQSPLSFNDGGLQFAPTNANTSLIVSPTNEVVAVPTVNSLFLPEALMDEPPALLPVYSRGIPSTLGGAGAAASPNPLSGPFRPAVPSSTSNPSLPQSAAMPLSSPQRINSNADLPSSATLPSSLPHSPVVPTTNNNAAATRQPLHVRAPNAEAVAAAVAQLDPILSTWQDDSIRAVVAEDLLFTAIHDTLAMIDMKNKSLGARLEAVMVQISSSAKTTAGDAASPSFELDSLSSASPPPTADSQVKKANKPPMSALLTEVVEFLASFENTDLLLLQALVGSPKLLNALVSTANHRVSNMAQALSSAGDKRASAFIGWESPNLLWRRWSLLPHACHALYDRHETFRLLATHLSEALKTYTTASATVFDEDVAEAERLAYQSMKKVLQQHREFDANVVVPLPLSLLKFLDKHWQAMPTIRQIKESLTAAWIVSDGSAVLDMATGGCGGPRILLATNADDYEDDNEGGEGSIDRGGSEAGNSPTSFSSRRSHSPMSPSSLTSRGSKGGFGMTPHQHQQQGTHRGVSSTTTGFADLLYQFDSVGSSASRKGDQQQRSGGNNNNSGDANAHLFAQTTSSTASAAFALLSPLLSSVASGGGTTASSAVSKRRHEHQRYRRRLDLLEAARAAIAQAKSRHMLQTLSSIASFMTVHCAPSCAVRIVNAAETILQSALQHQHQQPHSNNGNTSPSSSNVVGKDHLVSHQRLLNTLYQISAHLASTSPPGHLVAFFPLILKTFQSLSVSAELTAHTSEGIFTNMSETYAARVEMYRRKVRRALKKKQQKRSQEEKQQHATATTKQNKKQTQPAFELDAAAEVDSCGDDDDDEDAVVDAAKEEAMESLSAELSRINKARDEDAVKQCIIYAESMKALRQLLHHLAFRVSELPNEWLSGNALLQCVACYLASTASPSVLAQREEELEANAINKHDEQGGGGGDDVVDGKMDDEDGDDAPNADAANLDASLNSLRKKKSERRAGGGKSAPSSPKQPLDTGLNDDLALKKNNKAQGDDDAEADAAFLTHTNPFRYAPKIPASLVAKCNAEAALTVPTAEAFLKTMAKHFSSPAVGEHTAVILTLLHHLPTKKVSSMLQIDASADTADTLSFCERRSMHVAVLPTVQPFAIAAVLCEAVPRKVLPDGTIPEEDSHTLAATSVSSYSEQTDLCLKIGFEVTNPLIDGSVPDLAAGVIQLYSTTPGVVFAANYSPEAADNKIVVNRSNKTPFSPSLTAAALIGQRSFQQMLSSNSSISASQLLITQSNPTSPPQSNIFLSIPLCGNKIRTSKVTSLASSSASAGSTATTTTVPTIQLSASVTTVVRVTDSRPITIAGNFIGADGKEVPLCVRTRAEQTAATLNIAAMPSASPSPPPPSRRGDKNGGTNQQQHADPKLGNFTLGSPALAATPPTALPPPQRLNMINHATLTIPSPTLTLEPSRYVFAVAKNQPLPTSMVHLSDLPHCTLREVPATYATRLAAALGSRASYQQQRNLAYRGGAMMMAGGGSSIGRSAGGGSLGGGRSSGGGASATQLPPIVAQTYFLYVCPGDVIAVQITPIAPLNVSQKSAAVQLLLDGLDGYLDEDDDDDTDDGEEEANPEGGKYSSSQLPTAASLQIMCGKNYLLGLADRILNEFVAEV